MCVGVGGVFTITGVPLSLAAGGVPGGVLFSRDTARARDSRLIRSAGPAFCSCVSPMALFEGTSISVAVGSLGGSGTAI